MRETALALLLASMVTALVTAAAPEGKLRSFVSFAAGLALLLVLASPLRSLDLGTIRIPQDGFLPPETLPYEEWSSEMQAEAERAASEALSRAVERACNLPRGSAEVSCSISYQEGEARVSTLSVRLTGGAVLGDLPAVRRYLEREVGIECEVILDP